MASSIQRDRVLDLFRHRAKMWGLKDDHFERTIEEGLLIVIDHSQVCVLRTI